MDSTATVSAPTDFTYSEDGCATQIDTLYALLACDIDQDGVVDEWLAAGILAFQLFPDLSLISVENEADCCPFLVIDCTEAEGFLITNTYDNQGATPDCSTEVSNGLIRFIVVNQNAPTDLGTCTTLDLVTVYDCRICPTVTTPIVWSETFCVTGQPNYGGAATTIVIDNPSNTSGGIRFWLDEAYTIPAPERLTHTGRSQCAVETIPIYVSVVCDRNQDGQVDEQLAAGDFTVTLYPAPQAPIIDRILIANDECQYQVIPACPDDQLSTPTFGPLPVVSFAGATDITVTSGFTDSPCAAATFTVAYPSCSICPFELNIRTVIPASGSLQFYNTVVVQVTGALPPFHYDLEKIGNVRRTIRTQEDPIGALINIQYSNGSTWSLTLTDDDGCVGTLTNNGIENEMLDIDAVAITPSSSATAHDGSIEITVSGGVPPYSYLWYGPLGFTATTADISDLHYGGYQVTVTDNSIPQQQQAGFYWVAPSLPLTGGGVVRGKTGLAVTTYLQVHPNPIQEQTTITFGVAATSIVQVKVYTISGQQVAHVYTGTLEAGLLQQVDWGVAELAAGLYLIELRTDSGVRAQRKVVVVR